MIVNNGEWWCMMVARSTGPRVHGLPTRKKRNRCQEGNNIEGTFSRRLLGVGAWALGHLCSELSSSDLSSQAAARAAQHGAVASPGWHTWFDHAVVPAGVVDPEANFIGEGGPAHLGSVVGGYVARLRCGPVAG